MKLGADASLPLLVERRHADHLQSLITLALKLERLIRRAFDRVHHGSDALLACGKKLSLHAEDTITWGQPSAISGSSRLNRHHQHPRVWCRRQPNQGCLSKQDHEGQQQVGQHSRSDHEGSLRDGAVAQQVRVIGRDRAVLIVIREGDESPQGQGTNRVGDSAPLAFDQCRAEADRKAADSDPLQGGGQEMTSLVNHNQQRQNGQSREHIHAVLNRAIESFWLESFIADVGHQSFRQQNAAIGLLAGFQHSRHRAADS